MSESIRDGNRVTSLLAINDSTLSRTNPVIVGAKLFTGFGALDVAIVDGSGNQITTFGGGTQYTDGTAVSGSPIGTGVIFNNGGTYTFVSAANPLPVSSTTSVVSTNNSSTATLLSGATFTGTSDDCLGFSEVRINVISDQASATNGLSVQQSSNNSNWDITDVYTIAAATGKVFVIARQARYIRVVYTNGGTNQGSFRLQTILNATASTPSSQRPSDAYTNETDLQQVWSFLSVWNGTTWDRALGNATGGLFMQGPGASGAAAVGNPVRTGAVYRTTIPTFTDGQTGDLQIGSRGSLAVQLMGVNSANSVAVSSSFNDATSNSTGALFAGTMGFTYNGTTLDRIRSAVNATNSTGTGIQATGILAQFDDVSPTAITENQFGNLRMSANRNLYGTIRDAAGNERGANVDAAGNVGVSQKSGTATLSNVAASATSVTVLAANTARIGGQITNDSSAVVYLKFGTTASTTSYTVVLAGAASAPFSYYEIPAGYTGRIDGIWASATGNARVTEET